MFQKPKTKIELLFDAVKNNNINRIRKLILIKKVPVDSLNENKETPLMVASMLGHKLCLKILLELGANINARDSYGMTPLLLAVLHNQEKSVKHLLRKKANVNIVSYSGYNILSLAYRYSFYKIYSYLLIKLDLDKINFPLTKTTLDLKEIEGEVFSFLNS